MNMSDLSNLTPNEQAAVLMEGCENVEPAGGLAVRLSQRKRLRVKLGLDPTSPDLHLGHAVVLRKLQQFVLAGHDVTLVIGLLLRLAPATLAGG